MKIVVVSTPIFPFSATGTVGYSGLEMLAWQQAKGLAEKGHQVWLVAPEGSVCPGVEIIPIGPARSVDERRAHSMIWGKYLEIAPDAIIDNSWQKWSYCLKAEGKLKCPILGVFHAPIKTMYSVWPPKYSPPAFADLPPVDKACPVCISEDQATQFEELHERDVRVCYNGVDESFYRPLSVPRTDRFLFLARFSRIKGASLAIKACLAAGAGLDLVGDTELTQEPDYLTECKKLSEGSSPSWNKSKGKQIKFIGPATRGECVYHFSRAHALLHPNFPCPELGHPGFREPFGLAPVEAMLCGCPVIAGNWGAMRETILPGISGLLVSSFNELISAISLLHKEVPSPEDRQSCREWAIPFSLNHMIDRYDSLIKEAIESPW